MGKLSQHRLEYLRQYKKQYLLKHPEKKKEYAINKAVSLLKRNGYIVVKEEQSNG